MVCRTVRAPLRVTFRDAYISPDGVYRYWLERCWDDADRGTAPYVLWCMLNPSTADAFIDDATIRRCMGFSDAWGAQHMVVVNLYAYRATNPRDLEGLNALELQGPENHTWLRHWTDGAAKIVCAWGGNRFACLPLPSPIAFAPRWALGFTKSGEPKHPLYLAAETQLQAIHQ